MINKIIIKLVLVMGLLIPTLATAQSQGIVEIHDPLREITFYSIEISRDPVNDLQFNNKLFPENDLMNFGISALLFDASKTVDEYVLWFHHDGSRRWFTSLNDSPLTIHYQDRDSQPRLLHISSSIQTGDSGKFTEKLEFVLSAEEFMTIVDSDSVELELVTALGSVIKKLTYDDLSELLRFDARVRKLHSESYSYDEKMELPYAPLSGM